MTLAVADATASVWRNRIVGHADISPAELVPNPRNWRAHPQEQQRALAGALGEVGWVAEVLVNRTTGHVVDGHLRIELALARDEPTVPVTYVDLTDDEERLVLASLDPLAAMASAEQEQLAALLEGLEPADEALRALLDDLAREYRLDALRSGLADPDEVPAIPDEPYVVSLDASPDAVSGGCRRGLGPFDRREMPRRRRVSSSSSRQEQRRQGGERTLPNIRDGGSA